MKKKIVLSPGKQFGQNRRLKRPLTDDEVTGGGGRPSAQKQAGNLNLCPEYYNLLYIAP